MDQAFAEFLREGALISEPSGRLRLGWGFLGFFAEPEQAEAQGARAIFYAPDFFLETATPWLGFESSGSLEVFEFRAQLVKALAETAESEEAEVSWQEPDFAGFAQDFAQAKAMIDQNQASKIVPITFSRRQGCPSHGERCRWLLNLSAQIGSSWLYGFWLDGPVNEGLLGLTPELLLAVEKKGRPQQAGSEREPQYYLKTMALAGTERPGGPSLLSDPKQCAEHQWVIRDICERLKRLSDLSELVRGDTYEWELPQITHLRTDITAQLSEAPRFQSLVELLHPTAALGSFPREALSQWGSRASKMHSRRGRFGAPFGFYQPSEKGPSWALVAIRNVQWADGALSLGSGCGVVKDSKLQAEWRELALKRSVVLKGLNNEY